ncbi:hypothetical protein [Nonomuraea rubra]|uniref:hypothetical protein n=1 Tax=Nonomuraea rubra TaxID=46180 RepID=UPI0033FC1D2C
MDVFISWLGAARVPRFDLEDTIEAILGEEGELTGGGSGDIGENIDIEIFDDADAGRLLARIAAAVSADVPANASYCAADEDERHLLRELLPGYVHPPDRLLAAAEGIRGGLSRAFAASPGGHPPFTCHSGMVDGTTVITNLVGRIEVEEVRGRVRRWSAGDAAFMIEEPLRLAGATAWEAHYNGVPIVRVPLA